MINEMMLQSHDGVMRVFPLFPAAQKASFCRLRTFGAFLVSSAIKDGTIDQVVVESEKGRPCVLLNPWPGRTVRVHRNGKPEQPVAGNRLCLATATGDRLLLVPEPATEGSDKNRTPPSAPN